MGKGSGNKKGRNRLAGDAGSDFGEHASGKSRGFAGDRVLVRRSQWDGKGRAGPDSGGPAADIMHRVWNKRGRCAAVEGLHRQSALAAERRSLSFIPNGRAIFFGGSETVCNGAGRHIGASAFSLCAGIQTASI